jgi:hypothetical protein
LEEAAGTTHGAPANGHAVQENALEQAGFRGCEEIYVV